MDFTDVSLDNIEYTQKLGGNIYYSVTPQQVVDYSGNYNILKTPKNILKALKGVNPSVRPDPDYKKAVLNLSQKHGVNTDSLVLEKNYYSALNVVLRALKARCTTAVAPCTTTCRDICRMNNCDVLSYVLQERKNFKFDGDDFLEKLGGRTDTVILSNPNNATGRVIPNEDIELILDYCLSKGIYVIVDETYMGFVPDGQSCVNMISRYYNLVVIRSLAEYYNLSGIGAAYVISCPEIIDNIRSNQTPWQVDVYGNALCENAYKDAKFDLKTKKWIFEEKRKFVNKLKTLNNVRVLNSDCHFLLIKLEDISATNVYNRLLKSNILIRDASGFAGLDGSYIRVAVKDEKSNDRFIQALLKYLI